MPDSAPNAAAVQYAALPFRIVGGHVQVMLVTSRETRRWVVPKGWGEKNLSGAGLAAKEAFEEAGIRGTVSTQGLGRYRYQKRLPSGRHQLCEVEVFALEVDDLLDDWPEKDQRERRWMSPGQAAMAVVESGLAALLLGFPVNLQIDVEGKDPAEPEERRAPVLRWA